MNSNVLEAVPPLTSAFASSAFWPTGTSPSVIDHSKSGFFTARATLRTSVTARSSSHVSMEMNGFPDRM